MRESAGAITKPPAGSGHSAGTMVGESSLSSAVGELCKQHPQHWNDLGPHHGKDQDRHHPTKGGG